MTLNEFGLVESFIVISSGFIMLISMSISFFMSLKLFSYLKKNKNSVYQSLLSEHYTKLPEHLRLDFFKIWYYLLFDFTHDDDKSRYYKNRCKLFFFVGILSFSIYSYMFIVKPDLGVFL